MSEARFEFYEDSDGRGQWRLVNGDGEVIADSDGGSAPERNAEDDSAAADGSDLGTETPKPRTD